MSAHKAEKLLWTPMLRIGAMAIVATNSSSNSRAESNIMRVTGTSANGMGIVLQHNISKTTGNTSIESSVTTGMVGKVA